MTDQPLKIPWFKASLYSGTIGTSLIFWFALKAIYQGSLGAGSFVVAVVSLSLLIMLLALLGLVVRKRWHYLSLAGIVVVGALIPFGPPLNWWPQGAALAGAMALYLILVRQGYGILNDEAVNRLQPRIRRSLAMGLPRLVVPIIIVTAALFYVYPPPRFATFFLGFSVPRPLFDSIVKPFSEFITSQNGAEESSGVASFLINSLGLPIDTSTIKSLLGAGDVPFQPIPADQVYRELNQRLRSFLMPYQAEAVLVVALGLLAALRGLSGPFRYLINLLTSGVFFGLVKLKAIERRTDFKEHSHYELAEKHE